MVFPSPITSHEIRVHRCGDCRIWCVMFQTALDVFTVCNPAHEVHLHLLQTAILGNQPGYFRLIFIHFGHFHVSLGFLRCRPGRQTPCFHYFLSVTALACSLLRTFLASSSSLWQPCFQTHLLAYMDAIDSVLHFL